VGCLTRRLPLRRFEYSVRYRADRHRPALSSREIGRSPECYKRRSCEPVGLLAPSMTSLFPGSLSGVTSPPVPVLLRVRVHPLMSFTPSSEYEPLRTCPARCRALRLPWGSAPLRGNNTRSPLTERASQAHSTVRPQRFSRSRRLAPPRALRVCFTPLPRPGFTFQGVDPAAQPERLIDAPYPLVVGGYRLPPSCLDGASSSRVASRVLIRTAVRSDRQSD